MKSNSILAGILGLFIFLCPPALARTGVVDDELLVKWKEGPHCAAAAAGNARIGSTVLWNLQAIGWQHVRLPQGKSLADGIKAYQADPAVLSVEPNRRISFAPPVTSAPPAQQPRLHSTPIPDDPRYSTQWNLRKIGAPEAWATTTGSRNVVVAVIDTGVDYTHPDLAPNMWRNPGETGLDAAGKDRATNRVDDDANGYVDDVFGINAAHGTGDPMDLGGFAHGTACAGIIGATGNNQVGTAGLNWQVSIMATSILWPDMPPDADWAPGHWAFLHAALVRSVDYVITMKRRGVNVVAISNSGGDRFYNESLRDAITVASNEGIAWVNAAGNGGFDNDLHTVYPSAFNLLGNHLLVASTDINDALASNANWGRGSVHLAAPGVNVLSLARDAGYVTWSGSSAACPHVAGAIALLAAAYPNSTTEQRIAAILSSVDRPASIRTRLVTGGRLNIGRAFQQITNATTPPILLSATPATARARSDNAIGLRFSEGMDASSVERAFSVTPAVEGRFQWSEAGRRVDFVPNEPWKRTSYSVRLAASAMGLSGLTLDGNYNRTNEVSPTDDFTFRFGFPPANDEFLGPEPITGSGGSVAGTTRDATPELVEPYIAGSILSNSSVWYSWTAATSDWITFETVASHDTLLAAYSGTNVIELSPVAASDDYGIRTTSRISFQPVPGTTYTLAVSGKAPQYRTRYDPALTGPFTLRWYPTPPPGFTGAQILPASAAPGARITLTGTNFTGATAVLFNGASANFANGLTNNLDLRITATVPPEATSGPITIVTPHGSVTGSASFEVLPPPLSVRLVQPGETEVSWASTSPEFQLENTADLGSGEWTPVPQIPKRAEGSSTLAISAPVDARFYRLRRK